MTLRQYQQEAIDAMVADYYKKTNSIVCLPQAAGKSIVIADFAKRTGAKVLVLAPTQELVKQDAEKLLLAGVSKEDLGIYAGSLKSKEVRQFTVGIINSVSRASSLFNEVTCIIIDECDLVNNKNIGMYRDFLSEHRNAKCYGLTATPYRNDTKLYFSFGTKQSVTKLQVLTRSGDSFWNDIIYCKNISDLTPEFLAPIKYIHKPIIHNSMIRLNSSGSDYSDSSVKLNLSNELKMRQAAISIKEAEHNYRSILVFVPSIGIATYISEHVKGSRVVLGNTPSKERSEIITNFKNGIIKTVISVDVLTAGFNYDELEAIVLFRPTKSIRKYQQMVGRVMRKSWIKECGTLIDLTTTSRDMGEIDLMQMRRNEDGLWDLYRGDEPLHESLVGSYTITK